MIHICPCLSGLPLYSFSVSPKKGMSALQLKRTLKVAYKTAWYLCHRIREAVKEADTELIGKDGIVECDEAYIGGNPKNMHKSKLAKLSRGLAGYDHKTMILGAIERGGAVRLSVQKGRANKEVLHAFIKAKLSEDTRAIMTDEHKGYQGVGDWNTIHVAVNHSRGRYVYGIAHTNTLENVWSLFKRSIVGSYHQISVKHMERYLDEFEFRFNNRNNPYLFRDTMRRLLASGNLEYKELTKNERKDRSSIQEITPEPLP